MIYIYIISDNNKHFETPIKEYQKRLAKKVQLKVIKPSKKDSISEVVSGETETMLQLLKKQSGYKMLLSI
jgi:23S rRNA pseudoU1915 N3-methylase RlmH